MKTITLTEEELKIVLDAMGNYVDNFYGEDDDFEAIEALNEKLCEIAQD